MRMTQRVRTTVFGLAAVVAVTGSACGVSAGDGGATAITDGGGGSGTSPAKVEPGSFEGTGGVVFLRQAADATGDVSTQKMAMEMSVTGMGMDIGFSAEGEFDNAAEQGHMTMDLSAMSAGMAGTMEMVIDGDTVYIKADVPGMAPSDGAEWFSVASDDLGNGAADPTSQMDPGAFLEFLQGAGGELETIGTEEVRGVSTTHVRTELDLAKVIERSDPDDQAEMEEQLDGLGNLGTMPAEAWIDDDGYVRKIMITFDFASGEGAPAGMGDAKMVQTIELYDFGEPVDVQIPDPSTVSTDVPAGFDLGD